ncbi:MAG: nitroreductase/quinone reductase family protein [Acidimicrobiales bacterium]
MEPPWSDEGLPYGRRFTAALPALHRVFLVVNRRLTVPVFRAGLGPLLSNPATGSIMVLRTRGRTSGEMRDVPLGYLIRDGAIYCCAGFGVQTHWFRNLLADPRVECLLPDRALAGVAEEVTDPDEWLAAFRALLASLGVLGSSTVTNPRQATDDELRDKGRAIPLVRIRVTGIAAGPADPGGWAWVPLFAAELWLLGRVIGWLRRRCRCGIDRAC